MPGKLYIGNLSFRVSEDDLHEVFRNFGVPVQSIRIVRDSEGRPRGYALAELSPETDLRQAIDQLGGKAVDGRALAVREAGREQD